MSFLYLLPFEEYLAARNFLVIPFLIFKNNF